MVTRYGYDVVVKAAFLTVLGSLAVWFLVESRDLRFSLQCALLLGLIFIIRFFRDPDRRTPVGPGLVISPADGRVVLVEKVDELEYLKSRGVQISIFMSPLNVHVNRFPVTGMVSYVRHFPGEFLVAFDHKSSARNERNSIGIENGTVRVLTKQIAGFVARRIVAPVKPGDTAVAGERFGMIRFGSRVDVVVPESSQVQVKVGDRAVAGETVLAVLT